MVTIWSSSPTLAGLTATSHGCSGSRRRRREWGAHYQQFVSTRRKMAARWRTLLLSHAMAPSPPTTPRKGKTMARPRDDKGHFMSLECPDLDCDGHLEFEGDGIWQCCGL